MFAAPSATIWAMADITEVPATDVPDGAILIDVREDDEWAAGHAPGAIHIPLGEVPSRFGEITDASDGEVYVVCRVGARSARAATWLAENGVEAINVGGGMSAWADAGRRMVSEDGAGPRVI